jgi:uncharacterized protein (DUF1501 family)
MLSNFSHLNRRHFMKHMAGAAALTLPGVGFVNNLNAAAPTMRKSGKSLIILWMGGGPSHMDLWDIKVDSPNQGSFKPIQTAAEGIKIGEVMTDVAKEFKNLSVIRALNSREGDHARGTYKLNHVFPPSPLGVNIPGVGAVAGYYLGSEDIALPRTVTIGAGGAGDGGFLGAAMSGFPVNNPGQIPENMALPQMGDAKQTAARGMRRQGILGVLENNFKFGLTPHITKESERKNIQDAAQAHSELYAKAFDVSMKTGAQVFQFNDKDTAKLKTDFGDNGFGRGCLLASKLVMNGVTCVEVGLGGWDMHGNIAQGITNTGGVLNKGFGGLMKTLRETGKINDTTVIWMGDFGRTPRINQGAGRDHWGNCWSIVLGGGGIQGGVEYGATDKDGMSIKENGVSVEQLFATVYTGLGIDLNDRNLDMHDNLGRRYYIAGEKENAKPIPQLLKKA